MIPANKHDPLAPARSLYLLLHMFKFRKLPDDYPDLSHSPLLQTAILTLRHVQGPRADRPDQDHGVQTCFVQWAVEHFDWRGRGHEDMFHYHEVLNEADLPPLELLHFLVVHLKMGRHYKGEFRLTKRGAELAQSRGKLFDELIPYYVLKIDHAAYSRHNDRCQTTVKWV